MCVSIKTLSLGGENILRGLEIAKNPGYNMGALWRGRLVYEVLWDFIDKSKTGHWFTLGP